MVSNLEKQVSTLIKNQGDLFQKYSLAFEELDQETKTKVESINKLGNDSISTLTDKINKEKSDLETFLNETKTNIESDLEGIKKTNENDLISTLKTKISDGEISFSTNISNFKTQKEKEFQTNIVEAYKNKENSIKKEIDSKTFFEKKLLKHLDENGNEITDYSLEVLENLINTNKDDISTNKDDINTNKNNISKNSSDISTNKDNISINKENILKNTTLLNNIKASEISEKLFSYKFTKDDLDVLDFEFIQVDTSKAVKITLPSSPENNSKITIKDATGQAFTNNITIDGNGNTIEGDKTKSIGNNFGFLKLLFFTHPDDNSKTQWIII